MHSRRLANYRPVFLLAVVLTPVVVAEYFGAASGVGPPPTATDLDDKIVAEAKANSEIMTNLTYLCDVIGPRLTGSKNLRKANEWAATKMKDYGLTGVCQEPWLMPEGWERGPVTARVVAPENGVTIAAASWAWRHGTPGKVEGDVVVLPATNLKELQTFKGQLKNAIVLGGPPLELLPLDQIDKAPGSITAAFIPNQLAKLTYAQQQEFNKARENLLIKEGAHALLLDAGKHFDLLFTRGGFGKDRPSAFNKLPILSVAHSHYALLHRLATKGKVRLALDVQNKFVDGPIAVWNTLGDIRGAVKPDEYVLVGAHLDSWDLAQGATDNGTGVAVILETARILAKLGVKPRRTIRFVLFTGEEQGWHGSKAYLVKHKKELSGISACLVHDSGTGKVIGIEAGHRPALKPILKAQLASLKKLGVTDLDVPFSGGSDHVPFDDAGIPGLALEQEVAGYRFAHHSQADTLDAVKEANLIQGTQVLAIMALRLANLDQLLPRAKT